VATAIIRDWQILIQPTNGGGVALTRQPILVAAAWPVVTVI